MIVVAGQYETDDEVNEDNFETEGACGCGGGTAGGFAEEGELGARGAILCIVATGSLYMFGFTTILQSFLLSFETRETSMTKLETSPKSDKLK